MFVVFYLLINELYPSRYATKRDITDHYGNYRSEQQTRLWQFDQKAKIRMFEIKMLHKLATYY